MFKFELGSKLKYRISGFTGICTGRAEYISGNICYGLQPEITDTSKEPESVWFNETMLNLVD